ncbi:nuclease [Rhynchospora pubera]|uniref:Nuclease n=1 Tax=Rhynchospora pubera TaxID=906938 RepID=A0AAV8BRK2_9POAL|nr:nuclease [Rhynchospora pubera]
MPSPSPSPAETSAKRKASSPPSPDPDPDKKKKKKKKLQLQVKPLASSRLARLVSLLASSLSLSRRLLSSLDLDLTLPPSLSLPLDSSLLSAALSLSRLLSLLPLPLQSLSLTSTSLFIPPSLPLPSSWFLRLLSSPHSPSAFPLSFRLSRPAFYSLLHSLHLPFSSLPPHHMLAIALFRLAHAAPFPTIARRFGLSSPSLACQAFYQVCHAITTRLSHLFAFSSDITLHTQGFHHLSLPNCCAALGYTRFPIKHDSLGGSLIAQALIDSNGRFIDLSVGWHGSMKPFQILTRSNLYHTQLVSPPRYVLGGSCCPLLPWLITPYQIRPESPSTHVVFNQVHACAMEMVNKAFGLVKDRWRLLSEKWKEGQAEALPYVVVAGCLLHNFLENCGEPVPEKVLLGTELVPEPLPGFADFEGEGDEGGIRMRDALASHLIMARPQV